MRTQVLKTLELLVRQQASNGNTLRDAGGEDLALGLLHTGYGLVNGLCIRLALAHDFLEIDPRQLMVGGQTNHSLAVLGSQRPHGLLLLGCQVEHLDHVFAAPPVVRAFRRHSCEQGTHDNYGAEPGIACHLQPP